MDRPTILLIEDDPNEIILTLLEFKRHHLFADIVVVQNGIEAMRFLLRQGPYADRPSGNPFLVLLDNRMPLMGGDGVLRFIRQTPALCDMPVVRLCGGPEEEAFDPRTPSIQKPITVDDVIGAARWLGLHLSNSDSHSELRH